jgi:hypothetical protein
MGSITVQMMASYYERFKDVEVVFTKELINATGLISEQVLLKCGSEFWPCVFYATTFQGAKIVGTLWR